MFTNHPLKRFGQNYLKDKNILNKIISVIEPQENDNIIEIGPGRGALTSLLFNSKANLTAFEIDTRVIDDLKIMLPGLDLRNQDFLKSDLTEFSGTNKIRIVGNIPYNITSPIIFKLLEHTDIVSDAVFMIQHEVAKRLSASSNTKDYGILTVILNYFGTVKYCFKVSPNCFYPPPKVDSAIIQIKFKDPTEKVCNNLLFKEVVKASFNNRRKTLKNSLGNSKFNDFNMSGIAKYLSLRAEQLKLEDYIFMTNYFGEQTTNYESEK